MATWVSLGILLLVAIAVTGCKLTRWGYESASYKVVRKSGSFEIRDYPALTLAMKWIFTFACGKEPPEGIL